MVINHQYNYSQPKLIYYYNKFNKLFDYLFLFSGTLLAVILSVLNSSDILLTKIIYLLILISLLLFLTFKWHIVGFVIENLTYNTIISSLLVTIWCGYKNILFLSDFLIDIKKYIKHMIILDTLSTFAIFILINFAAICIKNIFYDANQRAWLISKFPLVLSIIALYTFIPYTGKRTIDIAATLMTFSYAYGFIPRGLIGSIIHLLGKLLMTGVTSTLIDTFSMLGTFAFTVILILFFRFIINITAHRLHDKSLCEETSINVILLILLFSIGFGFSTFYSEMGFFDIYMIMLTIACSMLIISDKSLWAIIPLTAICVLIHQGYVFMYFNIVLSLLFYRTFKNIESKKVDKKSLVILILSAIICSVLFLYFQFFSHIKPRYTYNEVCLYIEQILDITRVHEQIVAQELFGEVFDFSYILIEHRKHLLVAFVLFSPYILLLIKLWKKVISSTNSKINKFIYLIMPFGIITTLPLWLIHIDYGRWCYSVCFYELIIILSLIAMKDKHFIIAFNDIAKKVKQKPVLMCFLFMYMMSIGALRATNIHPYLTVILKWIHEATKFL